MNANTLRQVHYALKPEERTSLQFAALARGDNIESDRLLNSAPLVWRKLVHHTDLIKARTVVGFIYQSVRMNHETVLRSR